MLEAAEIGSSVDKATYAQEVPELRAKLIETQRELLSSRLSVVIVVEGDDRLACDEVLNLLQSWLDPRHVETNAFTRPSESERMRPRFWRYWRVLPAHGRVGVFSNEWTRHAIVDRVLDEIDDGGLEIRLGLIRRFEQALADNATVVIKFWLHLPHEDLQKRVKAAKKDPDRVWRFHDEDERIVRHYDEAVVHIETALRRTSTGDTPWHIVESRCTRHRNLAIGSRLLETIRRRLDRDEAPATAGAIAAAPVTTAGDVQTILDTVDLSVALDKKAYTKKLQEQQRRVHEAARATLEAGLATVLVFEGWDAAGKGGAIRRLVGAMKAQQYRVVPIGAPNEEERARHYLWRFWRHLPRPGRVLIFDRSWYGRVLVERVEGFAPEEAWRRAYAEINDFEDQLIDHGMALCKFWLHIDKDEQLRRFEERERTPFKKFKITDDDWRNREKWDAYEAAVNEMVVRTSSSRAPWHLVASNDKRHARVDVVGRVADAMEAAVARRT
ncbi:MAG: polyphosphate:AMP phosphotransferase [Planctomycetota bacterium]